MKRILLTVLFSFFLISLWGENFECVYIDGNAGYLDGEEWVLLDFGDILEMGTPIKLDDFSTVQFDSSQTSLFFSGKGEYLLTQRSGGQNGQSHLTKLTTKIGTLLSEKNTQSTVAMGIRGNMAGLNEELGFGSTSDQDLEAAWNLINAGKYPEAERELEWLFSMSADPFSEGKLLFALAYTEEMQGKSGEAWGHLGDIIMPELGDYYPSYLLLAGQISFKGRNYVEAASSFRTFLELNPHDPSANDIKELLILCEEQI